MSKADKMFDMAGFKVAEISGSVEGGVSIKYQDEFNYSIVFIESNKIVEINFPTIETDLWIAINEKMKELGWLE